MHLVKIAAALAMVSVLGGCLQNDAQRGVAGAVGGAAIAGATGGNPTTGALVGGAAGVFCRDLNVASCQNGQ